MEQTSPQLITTREQLDTEWLTIKQLNELMNINVDTQAKYRCAKTIPFYKIGKRIMYRVSEINEWLLSHKVA